MKKNLFFGLLFAASTFWATNLALAYTDVTEEGANFRAIDYVSSLSIAKGYTDGSFRPEAKVSRAEFTKMVILAKAEIDVSSYAADCFDDVKADLWFSPYVCYAKAKGIVNGKDGGMFLPNAPISIAEASKIISRVLIEDVDFEEGKYWYSAFLSYLGANMYLPETIHFANQSISRGETAEMIWRISEKINDLPGASAAELENNYCTDLAESIPENIEIERVRAAWLSWYNQVRRDLGLAEYVYNPALNRTAVIWSEASKSQGYISHKRPGQTAYYDYALIKSWFKNLGLQFRNVGGSDFTENISWEYYRCPAGGDCTQGLIDGIRSGFNFFMSEKGKAYRPHYNSIVNKNFREIGLGIAIDPLQKKYYLTVHYGTEIISNPPAICQ